MTYTCKQPLCESIHAALILQSWRVTTKNCSDLIRDDLSIFNYERWSFVPSCPSAIDSPKKKTTYRAAISTGISSQGGSLWQSWLYLSWVKGSTGSIFTAHCPSQNGAGLHGPSSCVHPQQKMLLVNHLCQGISIFRGFRCHMVSHGVTPILYLYIISLYYTLW